ncbi:hypothetical protein HMPREF0083_02451, partial [Aneurinibacillus aneurinilyticus ATCC 12856]
MKFFRKVMRMLEVCFQKCTSKHKLRKPILFSKKLFNHKEAISMGFKLQIEGAETIELGMDNIMTVVYDTDT